MVLCASSVCLRGDRTRTRSMTDEISTKFCSTVSGSIGRLEVAHRELRNRTGGSKSAIYDCLIVAAGLVVNGQRILDLASAKDGRVSIRGDVELDIASRRTDHDDQWYAVIMQQEGPAVASIARDDASLFQV